MAAELDAIRHEFPFNAEEKLLNRFKFPLDIISYGPIWLALESMEAFELLETVCFVKSVQPAPWTNLLNLNGNCLIGSCFGLCRCIFELKPSLIIESIEPEHIRVPSNDHGIVSERTRDTFFAESAKFRVLNQRPFGQCATA